jgi:ankyrin repeat protein
MSRPPPPGQSPARIAAKREQFTMPRGFLHRSVLGAVIGLTLLSPAIRAAARDSKLDKSLIDAVIQGDRARAQSLIEGGADVNGRDNAGDTPLLAAAVTADADMMKLLLAHGADVNAKSKAGATALLWSVGDPAKVRLLLECGADVNVRADSSFTALLIATNSEAPIEVVRMLIDKGAQVDLTSKSGFTALMGAAGGGDPAIVELLLRNGANPRAKNKSGFTALHAATYSGNLAIVKMLLAHGAAVDPKDSFQGRTPLIWAAATGKPELIRLLIERGANANARETLAGSNPLICAASCQYGRTEAIRLLIEHGADASATDLTGTSALDWAQRQGNAEIVELLRPRSARPVSPERKEGNAGRTPLSPPQKARTCQDAVGVALAVLQKSGPAFLANSTEACISCHHQSLPAMAVGLARDRGLSYDRGLARQELEEIHGSFESRRELLLQGLGVPDPLDPAYILVGLAAHKQARDATTDALVHHLTLTQMNDGRWRTKFHRPPMDDGDITATALSLRSVSLYGPPGRASELVQRIERGRAWLATATPVYTEDRTFKLLGLAWAGAERGLIQKAASDLLAEQRTDGGWGQLPTLPSDAYATGQALYALNMAGELTSSHTACRRGVQFLLKTQLQDGSWFVQTRSVPVQPYFESGFPHGRSQFVSCAATAWATMALTLALPKQ